jgi:hypothetical protein
VTEVEPVTHAARFHLDALVPSGDAEISARSDLNSVGPDRVGTW